MTSYDHSACDTCQYPTCVYDDPGMSNKTQDKLCPAIVPELTGEIVNKPRKNSAEWCEWRTEKLKAIQAILDQRGEPMLLRELAKSVDVPVITMQSWCVRFFDTALDENSHIDRGAGRHTVRVVRVTPSKGERAKGDRTKLRLQRFAEIDRIIAIHGSLPTKKLAAFVDMSEGTLRDWVYRGFLSAARQVAGEGYRPTKLVYHVTGVNEKYRSKYSDRTSGL